MSEETPSFTIKKRRGPKASTSKLSFGNGGGDQDDNDSTSQQQQQGDDEGSAVVIRNRGKKTPAGRVKDRGEGAKRLSFGASSSVSGGAKDMEVDEAEPTTVVKRSLASSTPKRGLLRSTLPPNAATSLPATPSASTAPGGSNGASMYSKEYLDQLKSSQLSAPKPNPAAAIPTGDANEFDDLTLSKFGSQTDLAQDLTASIPTTNAIAQAKARREELRKTGLVSTQDDYISLSGGRSSVSTVGFANKGGDSRLVREEDELGDGDEDLAQFTGADETVPLGRKANRDAAIKLRGEMGEMIEEAEGDVSEEDEEMKRWEEAQIRRGGEGDRAAKSGSDKNAKKVYRPMPIPNSSTLPSLSAVTSRLSLALSTLESSHTLDRASLDHFTHERQDLDRQERELRAEVEQTEKKSRWFDEFKETVEDWAAFLDEKFPQLERIEKEYLAIQKERFEIVSRRRLADDSDDVALFTGSPVPGDHSKLFKRPDVDRRGQNDNDDTIMHGGADGEDEDESTREDLEPRSVLRTTRRAERQRRYQEEDPSSVPKGTVYPDPIADPGYSSDSALSAAESTDLAAALTSLRDALERLFDDVKVDDYRDPNLAIRAKFEEWRALWREEYDMSFGALGLVGVWEFWARVEMSSWNPFEIEQLPKTPSDLSQCAWHHALSSYGHREGNGDEENADEEETVDESTEVINALVTSVVIPRLEKLARESYDPLSSRQTFAAVRLVDEISYCVERDSPKFESLVQAFLHRLRLQVQTSQALILPHEGRLSLPALSYDPSTFVARQQFLSRQLKLLRACMRWRRFMRSLRLPIVRVDADAEENDGAVLIGGGEGFDDLVVRELVARVMLPVIEVSWGTGGQEIAQRCLDVLPRDDQVVSPALRRRLQGEAVQ